ncbi:hypothetical protein GQ600_23140 [Phytophthora cactorum]|nr:hypothetical protein GQ600_23140 [Phytophthora cactorum]
MELKRPWSFAVFYGVLFLYEIVEGVCLGWPGMVILSLTMNYQFVESEDVVEIGGATLDREQVNRLSEAFWRADGGTPDTPRQQVRTLSGIQAERRVLRARIRASEAKKKRLDEDHAKVDAQRQRQAPALHCEGAG